MQHPEATNADDRRWRWRMLALLLIVGSAVGRVLYLTCDCPIDLSPDEAHYWEWSRRLDWSYYSKGPLVAYLIRGSCELFGGWSVALTGSEMLAVRLPAVVCGALLLVALYVLTVQTYRREGLACAAVAIALTLPPVAAGSLLMTIDSPFLCCWAWALVFGQRALALRSAACGVALSLGATPQAARGWLAAGLFVALGILAKYTMLLWPASFGLFLLFTPACRPLLRRRGPWLMAGVALLGVVPILVWNAQNDWVTFRHVGSQAGVTEEIDDEDGVRWLGPFEFLGGQFALLLGYWLVAWLAAMARNRPGRSTDPAVGFLWWMSAPVFGVFLLASFRTAGQVNWPVAGYLSGLVLTVAWVARQVTHPVRRYRRLAVGCLAFACVLGGSLTLVAHRPEPLRPLLVRLAGPPTEKSPIPARRIDPTCRLRGWHVLAAEIDRLRTELERDEGRPPLLAGFHWGLPGEVGFYCAGHPEAFTFGTEFGDRHSQYDLWRPNPLADPQYFEGRTFLFVGPKTPELERAFEAIQPAVTLLYREGGHPIAVWPVWVCRSFRGFDASRAAGDEPGF